MSVETRNGNLTPGSITARCCIDCTVGAATRDKLLKELHQRIALLFTSQELHSHEIAEILADDETLVISTAVATRSSFVRKVIAAVVDPELVREIHSRQRAAILEGHREEINDARNSYMEKAGMFVWKPEETDVLKRMMSSERYLHPVDRQTKKRETRERARHCNVDAMLETLKDVYPEREFTRNILTSKMEYLRSVERKRKKLAIVSDLQTSQVPQGG